MATGTTLLHISSEKSIDVLRFSRQEMPQGEQLQLHCYKCLQGTTNELQIRYLPLYQLGTYVVNR